ncbi:hypothetical protein BDY19DRAFT_997737 [Irpex rosettiformis]|uniref:Uncharacterized protein n=1 Tax=Irpex rosettiformis TaxID=378272 RepID=A0ACB8TQR2_9APHY|nr:hypothetical protein BDY19DRAFT_997737 [Irpex rosettiformis]
MASTSSSTPSLTPSRSTSPQPPLQPDHFYAHDGTHFPSSPNSEGRTWLSPEDDPLAQRGIPVFKPTMEEFQDFEGYMNRVECWGNKSGIVKIIPPQEWRDSLPSVNPQLMDVKLKNPIEQQMMGRAGLFRQQNIERRKFMSVREWSEFCAKEEMRAPSVAEIDLHARATNGAARPSTTSARRSGRRKTRGTETAEPEIIPEVIVKEEQVVGEHEAVNVAHVIDDGSEKPLPETAVAPVTLGEGQDNDIEQSHIDPVHTPAAEDDEHEEEKQATKARRNGNSRKAREAALAERAAKDKVYLESFDPHADWLPPNTKAEDYTPEFCKELERRYWRTCGLGKSAWYGADMAGSLFTDETKAWNVAHLPSALSRLLPASEKGLPGVNTPYLYFGMWRATFAWHVEDMDLFSINYIHFGAPKFWYAIPQGRASALETIMRGYFPREVSNCSQFLRHKSFLASPTVLGQSSCRPNCLVQHAGEFVVTFPRGYHAGFNLGFNCAESVNFALNSWLDMGRVAKACECVDFSVRIDVDQLLRDREAERAQEQPMVVAVEEAESKRPRKRKTDIPGDDTQKRKKPRVGKINRAEVVISTPPPPPRTPSKTKPASASASSSKAQPVTPSKQPKVTLKLGPKPKEPDVFPCCLCVSPSRDGLLRVHDPPVWRIEADSGEGKTGTGVWMAHEDCANVVPETWVDEVDIGGGAKEKVVMGVNAIVNGRWNLKCSACTKTRHRAHGAPIQCTKGKCPKAFHVSCARDGATHFIVYNVIREVESDVILLGSTPPVAHAPSAIDPSLLNAAMGQEMALEAAQLPQPQAAQPTERPIVLKHIKKLEVEVLCPQHNPAITEAKKAAKQERIRKELLALPPMTRIKLRVSAGVFEVSLVRVVEETNSVEVIWDRGMKREFKWGSVVFGNIETVVGQKPTEIASYLPPPERIKSLTPSSATAYSTAPIPGPSTYYYNTQPQQPVSSTSYQQAQSTPVTTPYRQPQPTPVSASYQQPQPTPAPHPQNLQFRPAYQQPPTYTPFPQPSSTQTQRPQTTTTYYNMSRPWTSYQFPHYPSHGASSYAHTTQPIVYNPPPSGSASSHGIQRPGFTGMSYQTYNGYSPYTNSGTNSYGQLAQQNNTQASTHTSRASSVHSIHSSTPTPRPMSAHPTPPPVATRPGSAVPPSVSTPEPGSHAHVPLVVEPQPPFSAPSPMVPQTPVLAQFHVTTPASFVGQNELQWQVPYSAPR